MRKKNRIILICFLCMCMLLETNVLGFTDIANHFIDVSEDYWAYTSIQALEKSGMFDKITGNPVHNAFFIPRLGVSKLEFVEMLVESLFPGRNKERAGTEEWILKEIEIAEACGLIDDESYSKDSLITNITREEAAHLLAAAMDINGENIDAFKENIGVTDIDTVNPEYKNDVIKAYSAGLFPGRWNGEFNPRGNLHRDEEAVLIQRLNDAGSRIPAKGDFVLEDYIFLGDSLISNPHYSDDIFRSNGHQVFAGGGAVTGNFTGLTTKRVTVGYIGAMTGSLKDRYFNGIVILLGANDLSRDEATEIMTTYSKLLTELHDFCDKPIFVLKVFPVSTGYSRRYGSVETRMRRTDELNDLLKEYCDETDGVWFADATGPFTDSDGYLAKGAPDGLHIDERYYDKFYSSIVQALYDTGVFVQAPD